MSVRRCLHSLVLERPSDDEPGRSLLHPLGIGPIAFGDSGWPVESIQIVESITSTCNGRLVLLQNSLDIGDCNQQQQRLVLPRRPSQRWFQHPNQWHLRQHLLLRRPVHRLLR